MTISNSFDMSDDDFLAVDNAVKSVTTKKKYVKVLKITKKNKSDKEDSNKSEENKENNDVKKDDKDFKTCHKCNLRKLREEFSKHKTTKDGLDNRCKNCVKEVKNRTKSEYKTLDINYIKNLDEYLDINEPDLEETGWQGGKLYGTIFKRTGADKYTVTVKNKSATCLTYDDALEKMKEFNNKLGLKKNQYKIIKYNKKKYILMQISNNYVTLFDFSKLDILRKVYLNSTKSSMKSNPNTKSYCICNVDNRMGRIHNVITGFEMCDHMNRYPLDNRGENLVLTTSGENNSNRTNISYKKINENNGKYCAKIKWVENKGDGFQPMEDSKTFSDLDKAKKWLNDRENTVSTNKICDPYISSLKSSYEEIMKKYAEDFKWCDNDDTKNNKDSEDSESENESENESESEDSDSESENENNKIQKKPKKIKKIEKIEKKIKKDSEDNLTVNLTKQEKYDLFKKIDKEFSLNKYSINIKCNTLQIIKYNGIEYKFCGSCKSWVNYTENNFKKYCKTCTSIRNKNDVNRRERNKLWKIKNKEKIAEYNKKYREEKLVKT